MFRTDRLPIEHSVHSGNKTKQWEMPFWGSRKPWLTWLHFMPSAGLAAAAWRAPLACVERLLTRTVHLILHRLETFCGAEKAKPCNQHYTYGKEQKHFCGCVPHPALEERGYGNCDGFRALSRGRYESCMAILPNQPLSTHVLFLICFTAND